MIYPRFHQFLSFGFTQISSEDTIQLFSPLTNLVRLELVVFIFTMLRNAFALLKKGNIKVLLLDIGDVHDNGDQRRFWWEKDTQAAKSRALDEAKNARWELDSLSLVDMDLKEYHNLRARSLDSTLLRTEKLHYCHGTFPFLRHLAKQPPAQLQHLDVVYNHCNCTSDVIVPWINAIVDATQGLSTIRVLLRETD
ncbi:hypothetical protein EJ08DRAFT_77682 [Tothia fuscella]|uniref:Uncharacterized protein n=1 Tax=Tothia fuscella TaxID=1048955 RepID=A0A9P4U1W5_9PEZI|nr:hypothetical protein EJ08DRAFT_77682 [Tothia fuscella]